MTKKVDLWANQIYWNKTLSYTFTSNRFFLHHCMEKTKEKFLNIIYRSQKIAGTTQALLGGEEIYHYSTKVENQIIIGLLFILSKKLYQVFSILPIKLAYDERTTYWWILLVAPRLWIFLRKWLYFSRNGCHIHTDWSVKISLKYNFSKPDNYYYINTLYYMFRFLTL